MKLVKKLVVLVIVVVLGLVVGAFVWIDHVAKAGVEAGATYALGVDTTLGSMDVGVLSGRVDMSKLNVANPGGFKASHFLQLSEGGVGVSLGSLMGDEVVLPELTLSGIKMSLEHNRGKANYKVIMDNLKKFESKEKPAEDSGSGKRFVINKVAIEDVQVDVQLLPLAGELTRVPVKIDRIELRNVGSGSDKGVLLADLTNILLKAILKAVVDKAGNVLPGDIAGELTAGLDQLKGLGDTTMAVVGQVTSEVGAAAEQVGKAVDEGKKKIDEGAKQIEEGAKKAGEDLDKAGKELEKGLGGLLGKDKKKEGDK